MNTEPVRCPDLARIREAYTYLESANVLKSRSPSDAAEPTTPQRLASGLNRAER